MRDIQPRKSEVSYDPKSSAAQVLIGECNVKLHFQTEDPPKCIWHLLFEAWSAEGVNAFAIVEKKQERNDYYE